MNFIASWILPNKFAKIIIGKGCNFLVLDTMILLISYHEVPEIAADSMSKVNITKWLYCGWVGR